LCVNKLLKCVCECLTVHAHRRSISSTEQLDDEQKEEPVAERRRSSFSELGSKLTSLILPLKMLVQPKDQH